jgi:hypothetical protein
VANRDDHITPHHHAPSLPLAVDFNHRSERHLSRSALATLAAAFWGAGDTGSGAAAASAAAQDTSSAALPLLRRPTALVAGVSALPPCFQSWRLAAAAASSRKRRPSLGLARLRVVPSPSGSVPASGSAPAAAVPAADLALARAVVAAMHVGGCVLLPCDTAGRVLELLLRLDGAWEDAVAAEGGGRGPGAAVFPLLFLSPVAPHVLSFARTMLEYCSEKLTRCVWAR